MRQRHQSVSTAEILLPFLAMREGWDEISSPSVHEYAICLSFGTPSQVGRNMSNAVVEEEEGLYKVGDSVGSLRGDRARTSAKGIS